MQREKQKYDQNYEITVTNMVNRMTITLQSLVAVFSEGSSTTVSLAVVTEKHLQ